MDKNIIVSITAIICLTILGIFIAYAQPEASKLLYAIVGIIGGIAGYSIPKAVNSIQRRAREKNR